MSKVLKEGQLVFDFTAALSAEHLDEEAGKMAHCMKAADFVVEWPDDFWFVEVKDPSNSKIPREFRDQRLEAFMVKINNETLFSNELGPKIKDSFLYLHLCKKLPSKPMKYMVLLAIGNPDPGLLLASMDALKLSSCLLGPDRSAWDNNYLEDVLVFNELTWNESLKQCPVKRDKGV